jgi:hypothetical protein
MKVEYVLEKTTKVKVTIDLPKGKNFFSESEKQAIKKAHDEGMWEDAKEFVNVKRLRVIE